MSTPIDLTDEEAREIAELQAHDAEEFARIERGFKLLEERYWPLWRTRVDKAVDAHGEDDAVKKEEIREKVEKNFVETAKDTRDARDTELLSLISRTSILVAAATLLFAVFALRTSSGHSPLVIAGTTLLITALLMAAVAFIAAIKPLAVPFKRALKERYEPTEYWSLVTVDNFTTWVNYCYQANRKNIPIQKYKIAHAWSARLLVIAAVVTIPGLAISFVSS